MKKILFMAALGAAALSSCSNEEIVEQGGKTPVEDGAVMFSAYSARQTRATVMNNQELGELGFGVFAYEQGATPWNTYRAGNTYPNFMYNQKVDKFVDGTSVASKYTYNTSGAASPLKNAPSDLAAFVAAPADIKALYEAPVVKIKDDATEFTDDQMNALIPLGINSGWTESPDHNTYGESQTITYAQYEALSAPLWKDKANLFALGASLSLIGGSAPELNSADYNALPADAQAYYTYTAATGLDTKWNYSPVKYFSNNKGALHSFFAYAPYQKDVKVVFTDNGPAVRYNATDDYDLLWGQKAATKLAWYDTEKQNVDNMGTNHEKIDLQFAHALSKVSLEATYFVDKSHNGTHTATGNLLDVNTTIVIRSVKFVGQVPSQGLLNLYDGSWTYEKIEESACEMMTGTTFTWDGSSVDASGTYKPLKNNMTVIPTQPGDKVKIQIVYDVITVDATNPKNNSTVTNTITSPSEYELTSGKSYKFKLDLGLTSVKFNATVAGWDDAEAEYVDLPDNKSI